MSSSTGRSANDQYVLRLDVSERPVNWPVGELNNLAGAAVAYSDVRRAYADHIDRCRFEELCAVSAVNAPDSVKKGVPLCVTA